MSSTVSLYSAVLHPAAAAAAVRLCNLYSAVDHQRLFGVRSLNGLSDLSCGKAFAIKSQVPPPHPIQKLANLYAMEILDTVH